MDFRRKAQRWASVLCWIVLFLSAVHVPARGGVAAADSPTGAGPGQRLAYIGSDSNLWLMNADGSGRTRLTHDGLVSRFAWAPDGQSIAIVRMLHSPADPERAMDVALLSLASSTETPLLDDLTASVWSIAWTPDATRLALLTYNWPDDTARVVHVDAGTGAAMVFDSWLPEGMGVGFPFITSGVAWSPDGRSLLVYGYPSRTEVLTVEGGAVTQKVFLAGSKSTGSLREGICLCPRWSPDGSLIACHDFDRILVVAPDGDLAHEFPAPERSWQSPAWSPDGARIATGGRGGLSVIDLRTGGASLLISRQAWEPSWSPDGEYLAFSLVEGLGGETHELQGVGLIRADGGDLKVLDHGSRLPLWQPLQVAPEPACGVWDGTASDERIELTRISEGSGDDCHGAFLFSNEADLWDLGSYTLELEVTRSDNANAVWITVQDPPEGNESTFLLPSLDRELHTFPEDLYSEAQVSVKGEMTLASVTADTALFLVETALALAPAGSCLVPEEQLAYAAVRVMHIVDPAVELAWERDWVGAGEELRQLLPEFLDRSGVALKEIGIDCGAEALKELIGKPAVIAKLAVAYLTWVPIAIYDYFKYEGRPVYATLLYEAPTPDPEADRDVVWSEARRIDNESSSSDNQLLADRDGRMWAFWEEPIAGGTADGAVGIHYRIWEGDRWGTAQPIPDSEYMCVHRAVSLPDGDILVKADDPREGARSWLRWDGRSWSAVPGMRLPLAPKDSRQWLGVDGQGAIHLAGVPARRWDGTTWRETAFLADGTFHSGAVDAEGNLHVVAFVQRPDETSGIEHWTWDGRAWSAPDRVYTFPEEPPSYAAPPALVIGPDGVFHLVWGGSIWQPFQPTAQPKSHWLTYLSGDGNKWSQPQTLFGPVETEDGSWWADVDVWPDGLVVAAWGGVKTGSGEVVYAIWGNQGNWAEPVKLSPDDGNDHREPDVEIDATGLVHVLWSTPTGGIYHVIGSRSGSLPASP